jgi:hypothetical protein
MMYHVQKLEFPAGLPNEWTDTGPRFDSQSVLFESFGEIEMGHCDKALINIAMLVW